MLVGTTATWQHHQAAPVAHPFMENHLHCLRDCRHSKELWILLGIGGQKDFFSLT